MFVDLKEQGCPEQVLIRKKKKKKKKKKRDKGMDMEAGKYETLNHQQLKQQRRKI